MIEQGKERAVCLCRLSHRNERNRESRLVYAHDRATCLMIEHHDSYVFPHEQIIYYQPCNPNRDYLQFAQMTIGFGTFGVISLLNAQP